MHEAADHLAGGFVVPVRDRAHQPIILLTAVVLSVPWHQTTPTKGGEDYVSPFSTLLTKIDRMRSGDEGQGLAEYALILALIAIVAIIALIFLGSQVSGQLSMVGKSL